MLHAIKINKIAEPEVMQWSVIEVGAPGKGQWLSPSHCLYA
jgi:hypothetical protein